MRTAAPVSFTLDLTGPRPDRVARALVEAIASGQVHDGDRLPSTRALAATFGLARTAVVGAYEELTAAGFLVARPGGATYVEQGAAAAARAGAFGAEVPGTRARRRAGAGPAAGTRAPPGGQAQRGAGASGPGEVRNFGVAEPAPVRSNPDEDGQVRYDLRPGLADAGLISERDWARAMRLAAAPARQAPDLREELAGHLRRFRGLAVDPADIFLFPSVSSALRDRKSVV